MPHKDIANPDGSLNLSKRVQEMVEYAFANPHLTQRAIAQHFDVSEQHISQVFKSKRVLAAYPLMARRRIKSLIPKATKRFEELMDQKDNLKVSYDVVTRVLSNEKVLDGEEINVNLSLKDVPISEIENKLKGFGAVGPIFEAHVLHEDTPSDGKADVTPNTTPNPEPNP